MAAERRRSEQLAPKAMRIMQDVASGIIPDSMITKEMLEDALYEVQQDLAMSRAAIEAMEVYEQFLLMCIAKGKH